MWASRGRKGKPLGEQRFAQIPDLSVQDVETMQIMHSTRWFARVSLPASSSPTNDQALCEAIHDRLLGRMSSVGFEAEGSLYIVFNIESGSDSSRRMVRAFAEAVALQCQARVSDIDSTFTIGYIDDPLSMMPVDYEAIKHL